MRGASCGRRRGEAVGRSTRRQSATLRDPVSLQQNRTGHGFRRSPAAPHALRPVGQELQQEVLPKSPAGAAVRYALNQWEALTRFLGDGDLEIDNGATERANRDIALGRGNWTFFGSDTGGKTAAVLRSFVASCKRCGVEPFAWFRHVLSRIPAHLSPG
jgi:transposase